MRDGPTSTRAPLNPGKLGWSAGRFQGEGGRREYGHHRHGPRQAAESVDAVHRILAEHPIGEKLHLVLIRGKELVEVDVVPTEAAQ